MDINERLHDAGQHWRESQGPALRPPNLGSPAGKTPLHRWGNVLVPLAAAAAAAGIAFGIVSLHGARTANQVPPRFTNTLPSSAPSPGVLWPADSDSPAAGMCGGANGAVATVVVNPDTPAPRCLTVTTKQRLRVVNRSNADGQGGKPIKVTFAGFAPRVVPVGEATLFDRALGEYIAPGVHLLNISLYPGGGAEVWLKPVVYDAKLVARANQTAISQLTRYFNDWRTQGSFHAASKYLAGDERPSSASGLPVLVSGQLKSSKVVSFLSEDQFTVMAAMELKFSGNSGAWSPGANDRFVTFTRTTPASSYLMYFATSPPATPTPANDSPCVGSQLRPSLGRTGPAAGAGHVQILLHNNSSQPCYLGGVFPLQGVTTSGTTTRLTFPGDSTTAYPAPVVQGVVEPGNFGAFWVTTQLNGCPDGARFATLVIEVLPRQYIQMPWPMDMSKGCLAAESAVGPMAPP